MSAFIDTNLHHTYICKVHASQGLAIENLPPIGLKCEPVFFDEGYTRHVIP